MNTITIINHKNTEPMIDLDGILVPSIPFIWMREQELYCPVESIFEVNKDQLLSIVKEFGNNIDNKVNLDKYYIVVQTNVMMDVNLYISFHSLLYRLLNNSNDSVLKIGPNYNKNVNFEAVCNGLSYQDKIGIKFFNNNNEMSMRGNVFIHNQAFSPPGCFHFRIDENVDISLMLCVCKSQFNSELGCLFILVNGMMDGFEQRIDEIGNIVKKHINIVS